MREDNTVEEFLYSLMVIACAARVAVAYPRTWIFWLMLIIDIVVFCLLFV